MGFTDNWETFWWKPRPVRGDPTGAARFLQIWENLSNPPKCENPESGPGSLSAASPKNKTNNQQKNDLNTKNHKE